MSVVRPCSTECALSSLTVKLVMRRFRFALSAVLYQRSHFITPSNLVMGSCLVWDCRGLLAGVFV